MRRAMLLSSYLSAWFLTASHGIAQVEVVRMQSNAAMADWIQDARTGRVFASDYKGNAVVEFRAVDGTEVRRIPVGSLPTDMIIKNDVMVVACSGKAVATIIDLSRNVVRGDISVRGQGPFGLFCSEVDNPWVYAVCNTSLDGWSGEFHQLDVNAMTSRTTVHMWPHSRRHWRGVVPSIAHTAMSVDGKWLLAANDGHTGDRNINLMAVDESMFRLRSVSMHFEGFNHLASLTPIHRAWFHTRTTGWQFEETMQ